MTTSNFSVSKSLKNVSSSVTPTTLALPSIGGRILQARSAITGSHHRIMVVLALASPSAHEADPAISPIIRSLAASPIVATVRRVQSEAVSRVALTSMQRGVSRKHDGKQRRRPSRRARRGDHRAPRYPCNGLAKRTRTDTPLHPPLSLYRSCTRHATFPDPLHSPRSLHLTVVRRGVRRLRLRPTATRGLLSFNLHSFIRAGRAPLWVVIMPLTPSGSARRRHRLPPCPPASTHSS